MSTVIEKDEQFTINGYNSNWYLQNILELEGIIFDDEIIKDAFINMYNYIANYLKYNPDLKVDKYLNISCKDCEDCAMCLGCVNCKGCINATYCAYCSDLINKTCVGLVEGYTITTIDGVKIYYCRPKSIHITKLNQYKKYIL